MAQQLLINNPVNTGQGTNAVAAANIINQNFAELYGNAAIAPSGADPSGVADSTLSLAAWISSMVDGGSYVLPAGTYKNSANQNITANSINLNLAGTILASTGFSGGNNFQLTITGARNKLWNCPLDGNFTGTACIADGLQILGGRTRVYNPTIQHFPNDGLLFDSGGTGGDSYVYSPQIQQWDPADSAWNTDANFTANGIRWKRPDCFVVSGYSRYSKYPIYCDVGGAGRCDGGFHPYNGRSAGNPMVDPYIGYIAAGVGGPFQLHDCYLDSGKFACFSYHVSFRDCVLLQTNASTFTADATGNAHMILVYATAANDQPLNFDFDCPTGGLQAGTYPVGFLPNGANTWNGSFAGLDGIVGTAAHQNIKIIDGEVFVDGRKDNTRPTIAYVKQSGQLWYNYQVSGGASIGLVVDTPVGGPNTMSVSTDFYKILAVTGTSTSMQIGSISCAVYNDGGNNLTLQAGSLPRWMVTIGGGLLPVTTGTYNIGHTTAYVAKIIMSAAAPGLPCIQVDNSVTTGATGSLSLGAVKPGVSATAVCWIPFSVGVSTILVPGWPST